VDNKEIALKYLYTDLAIKNMQLDLQHIKNGSFKIKGPYIAMIENMISKAINKRRKLNQLMHKNNIKIEFLHKQGDFVTYKFYLDGFVQEIPFMEQVLKKNVEEVIKKSSIEHH